MPCSSRTGPPRLTTACAAGYRFPWLLRHADSVQPLVEDVESGSGDQGDADRHLLKIGVDVDLNEAVRERTDKEHPEQHAEKRAAPAGKRNSTEQDCREHIEFHPGADRDRRAIEL